MIKIRLFEKSDWKSLWKIIEPVIRSGETYVYSPDISEGEAYTVWIDTPSDTYVAVNSEDAIQGTYYIKPNQPGLGDHICNCGYIVEKSLVVKVLLLKCVYILKKSLLKKDLEQCNIILLFLQILMLLGFGNDMDLK